MNTKSQHASSGHVASLVTALLVACIAFQLNASMLSPALATMAKELNTTDTNIGISQTWYFTTAAMFSLFLPRLSDIIGRRKTLVGMMALTAIGSVVSALTPNITWLFVGRIIQGVSGPTVPICLLMLRHAITDNKKYGTLMGLVLAVNGGIAGIDAFLGGWLVQHYGFRSIFWFMVAIAAFATVFVLFAGAESAPQAGTKMDWIGVILIVAGVGTILTALNDAPSLTKAESYNQATLIKVLVLLAVGIVCFILFWFQEKRAGKPMVEVHHLKERGTWATLLTTVLTMTGIFALINGIVPAFAQEKSPGFAVSATMVAVAILAPYALLGWAFGPISGRLAPTVGYTTLLRWGMIGSAISVVVIVFFGLTSFPVMIAGACLLGITYAGCVNIMLNGLGVALSPKDNPGFLPGMNAGAFNLGAGLSFLILPAVKDGFVAQGTMGAYKITLVVGLVILLLALATSFLIPRPVDQEA